MIRGICFDIDGTLATHLMGYHPLGYFEFVLAGMLCRAVSSPVEALEEVCHAEEFVANADPLLAAERLGINRDEYLLELHRYQLKYLIRHEDTLLALDFLSAAGIPVYITTNNTETRAGIILKSLGCSEKIAAIFTPQSTGARKNSPEFWKYVISRTGIPGDELLAVGDEKLSDFEVPRHAGFGMAFLLPPEQERRQLPDDWLVRQIKDLYPGGFL